MSTPGSEPPEVVPPDEQPTRRARRAALIVEDFRSVRRWLVLLGVLALAAAAVAAYALIEAGESADADRVNALEASLRDARADVKRTNRQLELERVELERRLATTSEEADVAKLERRLRRVERDVADVVESSADNDTATGRINDRLDTLSDRLTDIENRQAGGAGE